MTDHLEQAAERCLFLALRLRSGIDLEHVAEGAAQHLDYVAGLIRGGSARPTSIEPAGNVRFVDNDPIETVHLGRVTFGGRTELDELRDVAKTEHEKARLVTAQRDKLLAAARPLLNGPVLDHLPDLREVVERIDRDT